MIILGIETSCDETAVALVRDDRHVLAEHVFSQLDAHAAYGGVVPEIAARAHLEKLDRLIEAVMLDARMDFTGIDGIAATTGPGLIGGLLVGSITGKALAIATGKPFLAINHLEAHALTARLVEPLEFPFLLLLVSGGHTQLMVVEGVGRYVRLGTTIDDAVGEAFDKAAKMLGLGHPGGPAVERLAMLGDAQAYDMPRPLWRDPSGNFSFSGLKTKFRQTILKLGEAAAKPDVQADLCASYQAAIGDVLAERFGLAASRFLERWGGNSAVLAGGVAANAYLRDRLQGAANQAGLQLRLPPQRWCSDNAAMVAWAGIERLSLGLVDGMDAPARPRWPLDEQAQTQTLTGQSLPVMTAITK